MKKILLMAFAVLAAAACTREPVAPEEPVTGQAGPIQVTLVAGEPETRTELGYDHGMLKPYWSEWDAISVIRVPNFSEDETFETQYPYHYFPGNIEEGDGPSLSAQFTGSLSQGGQYRAIYPEIDMYENWYFGWEYDQDDRQVALIYFDIPSVQEPTPTSFDKRADLLVSAPIDIQSDEHILGGAGDEIPVSFTRANAIVKVKFNPSGELRTMLQGQKVRKVSFNMKDDVPEGGEYVDLYAPQTRATIIDNDEQNLSLTGTAKFYIPYNADSDNYDVNEDDGYTIDAEDWSSRAYVIAQYNDDTAYYITSEDSETATYLIVFPSILKNSVDYYDGTFYEGLPIRIETDDYVIIRDIKLSSGGIALQPSVVTTLNINLTMDNVLSVERKGLSFKNSETTLIPGDGEKVELFAHNILFPADDIEYAQDFYDFFTITTENHLGEDCSDVINLRYVTYEETDYQFCTYVYDEYVQDLYLSVDEDIPAGDYEVTVSYEGYSATCTIHVITTSEPIQFEDSAVEAICVDAWGGHLVSGKLTEYEASKVSDLSTYFKGNGSIESFGELALFTGLERIGDQAFANCTNLKSIVIPDAVTVIDDKAFYNCMELKSITLPSSLDGIGEAAFQYCTSLESIDFPEGFSRFSRYAFSQCVSLESIVLPSSFSSALPDYGFEYCTSLKTVTILGSVTEVGDYEFRGCTALEEINIPEGAWYIYTYAFQNCKSLQSISIPGSVTAIGTGAFDGCTSLSEVILHEGTSSIGAYAFENCTSLHEIVFPASLNSLGHSWYGDTFKNVEFRVGIDDDGTEYHGIKFLGSQPPRIEHASIVLTGTHREGNSWVEGVTVYVPSGSKSAYEAKAYITNSGQNTIEEFN